MTEEYKTNFEMSLAFCDQRRLDIIEIGLQKCLYDLYKEGLLSSRPNVYIELIGEKLNFTINLEKEQ